MLTRERVATISKLAFPVTVALSSTLVMSLVDLAMVRPLGSRATAAVGLAVFANALILAFVVGMGPAVQGLVARRRGEGSTDAKCLPLNAGILTVLIVGAPATVLVYFLAPFFVSLVSSDPEVTRIAVPFLRTLYTAIIAAGMTNAFKGFWTGMERPIVYMKIVLFINVLNFLGDYVLITGRWGFPALGATGAAISTAFSLYVGLFINVILTWFRYRPEGFLTAKPDKSLLVRIVKLALPVTLQEFFLAAGLLVYLWIVGQIGTAELAAMNVQLRVGIIFSFLAGSVGNASATLVARSVGAGDLSGASDWGWDSVKLTVILITLLTLPLVLFPRYFLSIFLSDPHTLEIAIVPWQLATGLAGALSLLTVFAYTLVSVGDGGRVALTMISTQWLIFLPAVWVVGPYLHYGLLQVVIVQVAYGAFAEALIVGFWVGGRWKNIRI
ncbi:MAG TPA: MATE family efflux transporter [Thermoanaerobaculia bacterium]|nr:MATE family efflux transporter [Thermoanaerobaculia bacterium]